MIAISDSFKNAIKDKNRQIKGYVEVLYDHQNIEGDISPITYNANQQAAISNGDEMIDGVRVENNFASLESNYFKLDGSFVLPNNPNDYTNTKVGFITDDIVEDLYDNKCYVRILNVENNENLHSITIYTKDNIPATASLYINYQTDPEDITTSTTLELEKNNNDNDVISFDFSDEEISNINYIDINLSNFQYQNRRVRINEIEFGMTNVYKDNDLIDFKVIEQISEFNTDMPIDECDVTLDNYDNQFDIMNPKGLTKYLNEGVKVIPYIGIITPSNGIEYVKMGVYYLDNYVNNSNKTTTFNCKKMFNKLIKKNSYMRGNIGLWSTQTYFNQLCLQNGINDYSYNLITGNEYVTDHLLELCSVLEQFNKFSMFANSIIRCGRNDNIICENIKTEKVDNLTLNEMKEIPSYVIKDKLKNIIIKIMSKRLSSSEESTVCNKTVTVSPENRFIIEFTQGSGADVEFTPEYYVQDYMLTNYFFDSRDMEGTYNIKITLEGTINYNYENTQFNYNEIGKEITIENPYFNTEFPSDYLTVQTAVNNTANYIKNNYKKYNVDINYFGNPAYEPNDVLQIETQYGNKEIRILKHTLTFNGALSGSIEGVGD